MGWCDSFYAHTGAHTDSTDTRLDGRDAVMDGNVRRGTGLGSGCSCGSLEWEQGQGTRHDK